MDASLRDLIREAKERRNFVAHHFFRERAEEFASRRGRDKMIAELESARDLFDSANRALTKFVQPRLDRFGISERVVEAYTAKYLQSLICDE